MAKRRTAAQIAEWAEAHTASTSPAPNTDAPHLTDEELVQVLRWDAEGFTQEQIAAKLDPPRHQSTVCRALKPFRASTVDEAKRIFAAQAAPMALKIIREGRPSDLIKVQEGQNVLTQQVAAGLVIQIGIRDSDISLTLSPPQLQVTSESLLKD